MNVDKIVGKLMNETIYRKRLKNGLTVCVMPKEGYKKQFASFTTKFGSNDLIFKTSKEQDFYQVHEGIAHFLEHKLFEEKNGNAFDRFSALGASVNAFTNFNVTSYYFTTTSHFYESLDHLIDLVQTPYFTNENVEKEKGIIEQEIKMYQDNPQWRVYFNFLKAMYRNHPVKNDIAGTVDSIYQINKEELYRCYHTFYHPANMLLFAAGEIDPDQVFEQAEAYFSKRELLSQETIERQQSVEPDEIGMPYIENTLSVSTPLFNLGYKDLKLQSHGDQLMKKETLLRVILDIIFGKSSSLFEKLYDKGLVNQDFNGEYIGELDYGYSLVGGESKDPKEVKRYIDEAVEALKVKGIPEEDFQRILKKQIGENLSYFNSLEYVGNSFVTYYFRGSNFLEYIEVLKTATLEEANGLLKDHFNPSNQVLSVIKP